LSDSRRAAETSSRSRHRNLRKNTISIGIRVAPNFGGYCNGVPPEPPFALCERLPAEPRSVTLLRGAVERFATESGAVDGQRAAISLAVSEAVSNAVVHAYVDHAAPGAVSVAAEVREHVLEVTVCDEGGGMRPRLDSPGLGLGLGMIARLSDRLELTETDPGVCVRMTFAIG
jgi:anti-sigma regulatory factor (Ser/Thr protein kinase)